MGFKNFDLNTRLFIVAICIFHFPSYSFCQKDAELEVTPFMRWDSYPKFNYAINPVNSISLKMQGISIGFALAYKIFLQKKWNVKAGLGYYRHSFTNLKSVNTLFGPDEGRDIRYTPPGPYAPAINYYTDRYWYNTLTFSIGLSKEFEFKKNYRFSLGGLVSNYFTYSQLYHIPYGTGRINYRSGYVRYFGNSFSITSSLQKNVGNWKIGPTIMIPVFDLWKQDVKFPEEENEQNRSKLSNAIGLGFTFSYRLQHKK